MLRPTTLSCLACTLAVAAATAQAPAGEHAAHQLHSDPAAYIAKDLALA